MIKSSTFHGNQTIRLRNLVPNHWNSLLCATNIYRTFLGKSVKISLQVTFLHRQTNWTTNLTVFRNWNSLRSRLHRTNWEMLSVENEWVTPSPNSTALHQCPLIIADLLPTTRVEQLCANSGALCLDLGSVHEACLVWIWRKMLLNRACVLSWHSVNWGKLKTKTMFNMTAANWFDSTVGPHNKKALEFNLNCVSSCVKV